MARPAKLFVLLLLALSVMAGCKKKRPNPVPPQAQAPPVVQPAPTPEPPPVQQPTATATEPTAQPSTVTSEKKTPAKHRPRTHRNGAAAKRSPSAPPNSEGATVAAAPEIKSQPAPPATSSPGNPVVKEGGTSNTTEEISAGLNQGEAAHQRQVTEQLLVSTEANLKSINRALTTDETAMLEQIRSYVVQSRSANQDGDLVRANNLALKAHLLSDALLKH